MGSRAVVAIVVMALTVGACSSGEIDRAAESTAVEDTAVENTAVENTAVEEVGAPTGNGDDDTSGGADEDADAAVAEDAGDEDADDTVAVRPVLRAVEPGESGEDVLALQELLTELGFAPGSNDGSYGNRTAVAVSAFQGLVGIEETGVADRATMIELAAFDYDGPVLRAGDEGRKVEALQEQLASGPFDPGPIDGTYGLKTVQAVWALEKMAGVPVDGDWGPLDAAAWQRLSDGELAAPVESHDVRWVEFNLSEQVVKVYDPGETVPTLVSHASSGSGVPWANEEHSGSSITPKGDFEITRRISGWRESSLNIGRLYNPLYFNGGIAFHGATSVPLYPASHGCIRLPMHIAEYLPGELPDGTPVHVMA